MVGPYENTGILEAEDEEDFSGAFQELEVKRSHQKMLLEHFRRLKASGLPCQGNSKEMLEID